MDLWVTLGVLIKRWYITLPLLGLVVFGAMRVADSLEPTFTATAVARVLCPDQTRDPQTGELQDTNAFCADRAVLDISQDAGVFMNSTSTRRLMSNQGLLGDYVVTDNDPPRISITAEDVDEQLVLDTVQGAVALIQSQVDQLQGDSELKYTATPLDIPREADQSDSGAVRTQITIAVAGLIMVAVLVHVFDALATLLARRRGTGEVADDDFEYDDEAGDPDGGRLAAVPDPPQPAPVEAARPAPEPESYDDGFVAADSSGPAPRRASGGETNRWGR